MTSLSPHINFNGRCREALNYYRSCFGGETSFMTIGESPVPIPEPGSPADHIMHGELKVDSFTIMGSDMGPQQVNGAISVVVTCSGKAEMDKAFDGLSKDGSVFCPVGPAFWGGLFGVTTDKFGVTWMLHLPDGS